MQDDKKIYIIFAPKRFFKQAVISNVNEQDMKIIKGILLTLQKISAIIQ